MSVRTASRPVVARPRLRTAGWACLVAGVLGALSALALLLVDPAVPATRWSYPQSTGAYAATQTWFAVQHLGLLAGLLALGRSGAAGTGRAGLVAPGVAAAGMVGLAATELLAILPAEQAVDAPFPVALGAVYGLLSVLMGAALVVTGVAVLRARRWGGWRRWVPLALGVWVFVPMTPLMVVSFEGGRVGIGGWMLLFALLGGALLRPTSRDA